MRLHLKTKSQAVAAHGRLYAELVALAGERSAAHWDRLYASATFNKADGLAWWIGRASSVAEHIVRVKSKKTHFIAPSPDTLAWGGFLGGEHVTTTDFAAAAQAENRIMELLAV